MPKSKERKLPMKSLFDNVDKIVKLEVTTKSGESVTIEEG